MTTAFRYQALNSKGDTLRGTLVATSAPTARDQLRKQGLVVLSLIPPKRALALGGLLEKISSPRRKAPIKDIAIFTRQMATLLESGVQIEASLAAMSAQSGPRLGQHCREIRDRILDGESFSAALRDSALGLDRFYLSSIEAAERAGRHGAVLNHLADHAEARMRNRQTIGLALIYPSILVLVSVAVVVGLLVFLLPDIVRVFASRGAELPTLTRVMIGVSDFLSAHFLLLVVLLTALVGGIALGLRRTESRALMHRLLWRSGLARQSTIVQFTGTLATLTQSGVPLAEALSSATSTVGNEAARAILERATQDVRDGAPLSHALSKQTGFDQLMITMLASGEASGSVPAMLDRYARDQSEALQARVKAMVGLVEPLVLLALGGVVMLIVLAILMPIVNLNTLVG